VQRVHDAQVKVTERGLQKKKSSYAVTEEPRDPHASSGDRGREALRRAQREGHEGGWNVQTSQTVYPGGSIDAILTHEAWSWPQGAGSFRWMVALSSTSAPAAGGVNAGRLTLALESVSPLTAQRGI
jgi:hypothetical protein